jgi:hypothetical protein
MSGVHFAVRTHLGLFIVSLYLQVLAPPRLHPTSGTASAAHTLRLVMTARRTNRYAIGACFIAAQIILKFSDFKKVCDNVSIRA